jgi:hypothetical protein
MRSLSFLVDELQSYVWPGSRSVPVPYEFERAVSVAEILAASTFPEGTDALLEVLARKLELQIIERLRTEERHKQSKVSPPPARHCEQSDGAASWL